MTVLLERQEWKVSIVREKGMKHEERRGGGMGFRASSKKGGMDEWWGGWFGVVLVFAGGSMLYGGWFARSDERVPEVESWVCTYRTWGVATVFFVIQASHNSSPLRRGWNGELGLTLAIIINLHQFQPIIRISAMRTIP
eukprot:34137_1